MPYVIIALSFFTGPDEQSTKPLSEEPHSAANGKKHVYKKLVHKTDNKVVLIMIGSFIAVSATHQYLTHIVLRT